MRCLIRVSNLLNEKYDPTTLKSEWNGQLAGLGNSFWLKWVNINLDGTSSEEMDKLVQVIPKQTYPVSMSIISFFLAGTCAISSIIFVAVCRADNDDLENMACCNHVD